MGGGADSFWFTITLSDDNDWALAVMECPDEHIDATDVCGSADDAHATREECGGVAATFNQ